MTENGYGDVDQLTEDRLLAEDSNQSNQDTNMDDFDPTTQEEYTKLIEYGIKTKVAEELVRIYQTGKLQHAELDERALDALKEFSSDEAIQVLKQFCESSLEHVGNKSAFLCGQMKTFRQKIKQGGPGASPKGPDEAKIKEILDRTSYSLDVTTGQRKYGGPPPGLENNQPGSGHEVFCGKIPKDIFEDELIPLFEACGKIWDLRLMMDPMTGYNRGYCFVTFCQKEGARESVRQLDNHEIRKGKTLKVNISVANQRLFVGNIPKSKSKDEIMEEFSKKTENLTDVIIYRSAEKENQRNRGFAFLEYDSHKTASTAKRKLSSGRVKVWGCDIIVDWADPIEEPDNETMSKVKVLYIRNLTQDVMEDTLRETFEPFGTIERVKKIKDYGFIHFEDRESAVRALDEMNGQVLGKLEMEISLAKPPSENKKKEQRKRDQERRQMIRQEPYPYDYWMPPPRGHPPMSMRGGMRRGPPPPPSPRYGDYYDDYFGYEDYDHYGGYAAPPARGRGRGGPPPPPPAMRGRGPAPMRGGGGMTRGGPGVVRGSRGTVRGRGAPTGGRGRGGNMAQKMQRGGKRKAGGDTNTVVPKRRNLDNWGAQPIAQQPLNQGGYGGGGAGNYDNEQWYQDSYGQNWG